MEFLGGFKKSASVGLVGYKNNPVERFGLYKRQDGSNYFLGADQAREKRIVRSNECDQRLQFNLLLSI